LRSRRIVSITIYILASLIGLWAFLSPFLTANLAQSGELQAGGPVAPLLLTGLVGLCYLALLHEAHGPAAGATTIALLGILVSINAALRFAETVVPGPGGFSPMFLLIILTGYVFGARVGFLMGALSLLVSALITGGVGPWLPFQMWAAGWVGMSARLVRPIVRLVRAERRLGEVVLLAMFAAFYAFTSFGWDAFAAIGNAILMALFAAPVLQALRRFHTRLSFRYLSPPAPTATAPIESIPQ